MAVNNAGQQIENIGNPIIQIILEGAERRLADTLVIHEILRTLLKKRLEMAEKNRPTDLAAPFKSEKGSI